VSIVSIVMLTVLVLITSKADDALTKIWSYPPTGVTLKLWGGILHQKMPHLEIPETRSIGHPKFDISTSTSQFGHFNGFTEATHHKFELFLLFTDSACEPGRFGN
jgi:hypothetical protein